MSWEHVDDPVHRLDRVRGVERPEGQVARLGERQRRLDGLVVPELTYQDDVWVLPQNALERLREAVSVVSDLALRHHAPLVPVREFDRILDGDDVVTASLVDVVDHRGERRRLARARHTREEDQA